MAWMQCRGCSTKFAVGLLRCPQCQKLSELFAVPEEVVEAEQEANVPKISVEGGPSNALGQPMESETSVADPVESSAEVEEPTQAKPETSDETSDATDEASEVGKDTADAVEADAAPASAPKATRKTAAKKSAAKPEPTPGG